MSSKRLSRWSSSWITHRANAWLFAPVHPRCVSLFKWPLAGVTALVFWPVGFSPVSALQQIPFATALQHAVLSVPGHWMLTLILLGLFGAGVLRRFAMLPLLFALAPLVPLAGPRVSRQVLFFALLVSAFLIGERRVGAAGPREQAGPIWPVRLIQLQVSLVYAVNALSKSTPAYLSGDVLIGLSRMVPTFHLEFSDGVVPLGPVSIPVGLAAAAVVTTEYLLAVGFWFPRWRWRVALLGVLFHATIRMYVDIFMLDVAIVFLYLAFLLPWDRPAARAD